MRADAIHQPYDTFPQIRCCAVGVTQTSLRRTTLGYVNWLKTGNLPPLVYARIKCKAAKPEVKSKFLAISKQWKHFFRNNSLRYFIQPDGALVYNRSDAILEI